MAELADALDLGSSGVTRAGSIPVSPTKTHLFPIYFGLVRFFMCCGQFFLNCHFGGGHLAALTSFQMQVIELKRLTIPYAAFPGNGK